MGTERRSNQMHSLTSMPSILMLRCFRRLRIHTNTTKLLAGNLYASSIITQSSPSEESHSSANTGLPRCCIFFAVRCSKEYGTGDFVNASFGQFGRYGTNKGSSTCEKPSQEKAALSALDAPQQRRCICLPDPNPGPGEGPSSSMGGNCIHGCPYRLVGG